jgi:4a-hydroxytetrahydrobiopterin dehydratase
MSRPVRLEPDQATAAAEELERWELRDGKLHREFRFSDFAEAFGFMAAVATEAARLDHHPEWTNVYGRVVVDLWTHDVDGLSELDLELARRMDELAGGA